MFISIHLQERQHVLGRQVRLLTIGYREVGEAHDLFWEIGPVK